MSNKKIWFITGAGRGFGLEISKSALAVGNKVIATGRDADKVANAIGETPDNLLVVKMDVTNPNEIEAAVKSAVDKFGTIDVLVNNAGIQKEIPLTEITLPEWYHIISVDLTGPFLCSREAVKHIQKQQNPTGGCIINISSVHQVIPKPHYIPYATSKAGIEMITKTMALELARFGIRANLAAPGAIETDMNIELQNDEIELKNVLKRIPIGRIGKPEEIANVVEFLASSKASYVTGTTLLVDGGITLYPSFNTNLEYDKIKHQ